MKNFSEKLRARGKVEEDLYFAKQDRKLLEAMHRDKLAKALEIGSKKKKRSCADIERGFDKASKRYRKKPRKLGDAYKTLLKKARKLAKR